MDQSAIIERLEEIQGIVEQQEKDSMELKKQLQRLEQRNQQLLEDSTAWQQQCNRLRGELASLQSQKPGVSNTGIAPEVQLTGMSLQNWQQDCIRLQSELEHLQQENQRLRTEILERDGESSGGCGCCCFQWCYYLFASKNRKNERSPGTAGITENSVTPNYYTNTGYTTIQ